MALKRPGPYVALSAHYADDEKIMAAGEDAELLYVRMLAYCARQPASEGWISDGVLRSRLGILPRESETGSGNVPGTDPGSRAERLREVGLVAREDGGWRITSWLRWNRSAEEMGKERSRDRGRKTGVTSGDADTLPGTGPGNVPGKVPQSRQQRSDTDTDTDKEPSPAADGGRASTKQGSSHEADFDTWWTHYPRKIGKGQARKSYTAALKKTDPATLLVAAQSFAEHTAGSDPKFVPHPTTWLNGERWTDQPDPAPAADNTIEAVYGEQPRYIGEPPPEFQIRDEDFFGPARAERRSGPPPTQPDQDGPAGRQNQSWR